MGNSKLNNFINTESSSVVFLSFIAISVILIGTSFSDQTAYAIEDTEIQANHIGSSVIELISGEAQREIRVFAEFFGFVVDDQFFVMKIIEPTTGDVFYETSIQVLTTKDGYVNFKSAVFYIITDRMLNDGEPHQGNFEMEISTRDGSTIQMIPFSIVDSQ